MAHAQAARPHGDSTHLREAADTRLAGPWRYVARALWLALALPCVAVFIISLPPYYQQLQDTCADSTSCPINPLLPGHEHALLNLILTVTFAAIWCGIGFFVFWRRSDDWLALLAAFLLATFDLTIAGNPPAALVSEYPNLALPLNLLFFPGQASLGVFFLLFPSGRFVPRWTVVVLPLAVGEAFSYTVPSLSSPFNLENWPQWPTLVLTIALYGASAWGQIYRYRHMSTSVERQQTKWVLLGLAATLVAGFTFTAIGVLVPTLDDLVGTELWNLGLPIAAVLIPIAIGFSVLRYRLYDIDILINRALVYGSLTAILAAVYVVGVVGSQAVIGSLTHTDGSRESPIVIVITTLVIAALFQPLRHRLQATVDRRFYRSKYDAER
ncbi:MAG TPA: hypothetical protein VGP82_20970, partial [Ktedonobacterales bacterium]|nr:hypothetical protein [Ktedonobacterales bacterium]